jgi:hypothetical protein
MPIRMLRLFIETVLPHSSMIKVIINSNKTMKFLFFYSQVSMFDLNDRLLKDSDRLRSLKNTRSSSNYIPIRFTLINTVTSLANCSCLLPPIEYGSSSSPTIIQQDTIDQILSTCSITHQTSTLSPYLSSSSIGSGNRLTPPSLQIDSDLDEATMDRITSQYGEICSPLPESKYYRNIYDYSLDIPLDLSMKKHSLSSLDSLSSQTKWIKT